MSCGYIDESGNTGVNLLDPVQPNFVTATMMTKTNFDLVGQGDVATLATELKEWGASLHAPWTEAKALQRPLPNGQLIVVETLPFMGLPVSIVEPEGGDPLRLPFLPRSEL